MKRINEAEGRAKEIELVAIATAEGIRKIAEAIQAPGGSNAVNLRIAESNTSKNSETWAKKNNTVIIPSNLSDIAGMVTSVSSLIKSSDKPDPSDDVPHLPRSRDLGAEK